MSYSKPNTRKLCPQTGQGCKEHKCGFWTVVEFTQKNEKGEIKQVGRTEECSLASQGHIDFTLQEIKNLLVHFATSAVELEERKCSALEAIAGALAYSNHISAAIANDEKAGATHENSDTAFKLEK